MSKPRAKADEVRLPLSLGVSCLTDLAAGIIAIPLGLSLVAAGVVIIWAAGSDLGDGAKLPGGMIIVGALMSWIGIKSIRRAWSYRPSDVLIGDAGIRIDGGTSHRATIDWASIKTGTPRIDSAKRGTLTVRSLLREVLTDKKSDDTIYKFRVARVVLAETDDHREMSSFMELADALRERANPESDVVPNPAPPATNSPVEEAAATSGTRKKKRKKGGKQQASPREQVQTVDVAIVKCGACGVAVIPGVEPEITCPYCSVKVTIPDELRERVKAMSTLSKHAARAERMVTRLLDQPSARHATMFLVVSTLFIAAAWPMMVVAYVHLAHMHRLHFGIGALVLLLPFLLVLDGFFFSRLRLVDRHTVRALALTFSARVGAHEGDPLHCRTCAAPLPDLGTTVVACAYCNSANVTRIDLRRRAAKAETSAKSLDKELRRHMRERWTWRIASLAGLASFAATAWLVHKIWVG